MQAFWWLVGTYQKTNGAASRRFWRRGRGVRSTGGARGCSPRARTGRPPARRSRRSARTGRRSARRPTRSPGRWRRSRPSRATRRWKTASTTTSVPTSASAPSNRCCGAMTASATIPTSSRPMLVAAQTSSRARRRRSEAEAGRARRWMCARRSSGSVTAPGGAPGGGRAGRRALRGAPRSGRARGGGRTLRPWPPGRALPDWSADRAGGAGRARP